MRCRREGAQGGDAEEADLSEVKEVNSMPGFDRTGPRGDGAMTGRGQGRCNPEGDTSFNGNPMDRMSGRGQCGGRGLGKGHGRGLGRGSRRSTRKW